MVINPISRVLFTPVKTPFTAFFRPWTPCLSLDPKRPTQLLLEAPKLLELVPAGGKPNASVVASTTW